MKESTKPNPPPKNRGIIGEQKLGKKAYELGKFRVGDGARRAARSHRYLG